MADNGATAIWSGYNHQGRVGLFVALREIARLKHENASIDTGDFLKLLESWDLVFELREDFEIIHKQGVAKELISRHQVKAYDSVVESKYSKVLTRHIKKNTKGETIYDETGNPVMVDGFNIQDVPEDSRFLHVIREINMDSWQNDFNIQLYEYPSYKEESPKRYCDFSRATNDEDELTTLAVNEIRYVTDKDDSECILIWKELQQLLQARITVATHNKTVVTFTFKEIHDCSQNPKTLQAYEADRNRRSILECGEDFIAAYENVSSFTDDARARTVKYIQDLSVLEDTLLEKSLRYLHIHDAKFRNINVVGMKRVVYEAMRQIVNCNYQSDCVSYEKDGLSYVLTVITEMKQSEDELQIGTNSVQTKKILKSLSEKDVALTFKKAKIINEHLDASFDDLVGIELSKGRIADREVYNFTEPAPLEFVSIDRAVSELNGGSE